MYWLPVVALKYTSDAKPFDEQVVHPLLISSLQSSALPGEGQELPA
jgi:hypothetical protein